MGQNTWKFLRSRTMKITSGSNNYKGVNVLILGFYKIALDTGLVSWLSRSILHCDISERGLFGKPIGMWQYSMQWMLMQDLISITLTLRNNSHSSGFINGVVGFRPRGKEVYLRKNVSERE